MAATTLAKEMGLTVIATTRNKDKTEALRDNGADYTIIDSGQIATEVKRLFPGGVNCVLELLGTVTLFDSLQAVAPKGILCHVGLLGNAWTLANFEPMAAIPSTVKLTTYSGLEPITANSTELLQRIVDGVAKGRYRVNLDRVFSFNEVVEAHRYQEDNRAKGKLVVLVD